MACTVGRAMGFDCMPMIDSSETFPNASPMVPGLDVNLVEGDERAPWSEYGVAPKLIGGYGEVEAPGANLIDPLGVNDSW